MRKRVLEHTPGPWKAYPKFCVSLDRTDWVICDENGDFIAPTEGNARLAAASPEMCKLLREAECELRHASMHPFGTDDKDAESEKETADEIAVLLRRIGGKED